MIPTLRNLSYEERLKRLAMFSLRLRRFRGGVIHGIDKVNLGKLFVLMRMKEQEDTVYV